MLVIWTALTVLLWTNFLPRIVRVPFTTGKPIPLAMRVGARVLLTFNALFISYFWLNGVKDFIYVVWYYAFRKKLYKRYYKVIDTDVTGVNDKILMAYCTCNDFDGASLERSMQQTYPHFDVVILDDSTSAVDTATDAKIRRAFREHLQGVTKIIIAQRISSVKDADEIIVMNDGVITGIGKHDELLANNAEYGEIYYSQMDKEEVTA